ncbi:DMT family transporter [Pararcticibacter amylolyticus]|uniref:QacE family quaternary ammonium compound efflux SMR transporter n=1 Tax=Pararcticibacter amylolyticus TaxID=2173175 RepID=A0A2U2PKK7_9SPHI|nr:multidrug efflux SMR transporter [Pararcticibacter amylolyticus]PWG81945.1 QacE family quaternary ammonium compound efflux SMR transporter [Pararcticibacter amylolyticus]
MKTYLFLLIAIISEIIATSALKASEQFSKLVPSLIVIIGYASAFYFLSLTLKKMNLGIAYALWSGVGIVLVTAIGAILYKQKPDLPAIAGIILILAGVVIINLFSKTTLH